MQLINIAIVEDEVRWIRQLSECLMKWQSSMKGRCQLEIFVFRAGEELKAVSGTDFDLTFMDIKLDGGMNGIETARLLRKQGYKRTIIFLTSYVEYACEGYGVYAMDYILKPISFEKICVCMDKVLAILTSGFYLFCDKGELVRIPYEQIICCLSSLHYVEIVTEEETFRKKESLKNLRQELPMQFEQCHRTVIVNVDYIARLSGRNVIMRSGEMYPISGTYLDRIRNAYIERML